LSFSLDYNPLSRDYIHFIALIKAVKNGGNITQNHSGLNIKNSTIPTNDTMVSNQYIPVDFSCDFADVVISYFTFVFLLLQWQYKFT